MINKKAVMSVSQILILIFGIVAFSGIIGMMNVGLVSGAESSTSQPTNKVSAEVKSGQAAAKKVGGEYISSNQKELGKHYIKKGDSIIEYNSVNNQQRTLGSAEVSALQNQKVQTGAGRTLVAGKDYPKIPVIGADWGPLLGHVGQGLAWSVAVVGFIQLVGAFLPDKYKPYTNALSYASAAGIMSGNIVTGIGKQFKIGTEVGKGWWGQKTGLTGAGTAGLVVGLIVTAVVFYLMYKEESAEIITFECYPWDAPVGGNECEECNKQELPCSEYQCRSLGQACILENQGSGKEICIWQHRNDVNPPEIKPWDGALLDDFKYNPNNAISPPDRGVNIVNGESTTGCVKAFTPLSFGITTNEPAKCKLDYLRKKGFEEMEFYFGGSSLFKYNHTQVMSLPGPSAIASGNATIQNDGKFEIYTRCMDANGNMNVGNFVFEFCVEKGPDTTPPLIVTTNLLNGMPIAYEQTSIDLEVYVNEPATCKWSLNDQDYSEMEETMSCNSNIIDINSQMLYTCATTLTGLKNRVSNDFYFKCEDQPIKPENDRNVNSESYEFSLIGTQPLVIDWVKPNGTIKDSTDVIKVTLEAKTSAGYAEGKSVCYYSETEDDDGYVMFFETDSHLHSQDLNLGTGEYEYFIKCIDLGGNSDVDKVNFIVDSDSSAPVVVRAYHEETYLKLVTDEDGECVYDTVDCSYPYEDGIKMAVVEDVEHYTDWNTQTTLYIKCQDDYGNQALPNECSIVVRPFEVFEGEE